MHLLVAVCYLSKFVVAKPLRSKHSHEVINQLDIIYHTFGTPDIIQHDQGPEFKSKVSHLIYLLISYLRIRSYLITPVGIRVIS